MAAAIRNRDRIAGDTGPDGCREAETRQQHECRGQRAHHGSERVDRVQPSDAGPDVVVAANDVPDQQRQRGTHQNGRQREHEESGQQVEHRLPELPRIGQLGASPDQHRVDGAGRAQQQRDAQRGDGDPCFEPCIGADRPDDSVGELRSQRCAGRKAAHVRGEHGGNGELTRTEDQRKLTQPCGLVNQRREPGNEKTK